MAIKKVGILGSAFDPPHYAHAAMAVLALESGGLNEIWLCPSPNRWDKTPVAPLNTRIVWAEKLAKAISSKGYPTILSTDELGFGQYRGSYVFLKHLSEKYVDIEFHPIVGLDAWASIDLWRDPVTANFNGTALKSEFTFLVVPRGDSANTSVTTPHRLLPSLESIDDHLVQLFGQQGLASLSSSAVRSALANQSTTSFVFPEIENEIRQSGYYAKTS